jgi:transcriptional antiterminator
MARANYVSNCFLSEMEKHRKMLKQSLVQARGKQNSKSRKELSKELGISDRELRYLIADCVKTFKWPILSSSGGDGYFYPSRDPEQAKEELEAYRRENASRINNIKPKCDMADYWKDFINTKEWW